tara:strand:+ start:233 stop:1069 length:837 start_codon:yes stop_codon:yes gene_type:complete
MIIKSYSKINFSLKINSKSNSGFHEIQSLYSWIDLADIIKIKKIKKNKDKVVFNGPFSKLVNKRNNSVNKILKQLRQAKLITNYYSVIVTKNIPVFGGLGGGTSNAAFILKHLIKSKIKENLLNKIESLIGSDFKLFFKKNGFLNDLSTIIELKKRQIFYLVLVQPKVKCSTKEIYSKVKKFSKKKKFDKRLTKSKSRFLEYLVKSRNDLQSIVENKYPIIRKLLIDIKNEKGCYFSRMTGSGSVCYGLFKDQIVAKKALKKLSYKYPRFWFSFAKTV